MEYTIAEMEDRTAGAPDHEELAGAYRVAAMSRLDEGSFSEADTYVIARDEGEVIGFCSLRSGYVRKDQVGETLEIFQMTVRDDERGQGVGTGLFETALDEAMDQARADDVGHVHMEVGKYATDLYDQLLEEMEETTGLTGERSLYEYCVDEGMDPSRLTRPNEPMEHLATSHGFERLFEGFMQDLYVRRVDD